MTPNTRGDNNKKRLVFNFLVLVQIKYGFKCHCLAPKTWCCWLWAGRDPENKKKNENHENHQRVLTLGQKLFS